MARTDERSYYTVAEAAKLLSVSRSTIWRWIEAERLPAYRVGPKTIRIKKRELDALVRPAQSRDRQSRNILPMIDQYGCAIYNALYLALAQRLSVRLITADRRFYRRIQHIAGVLWIESYSAAM